MLHFISQPITSEDFENLPAPEMPMRDMPERSEISAPVNYHANFYGHFSAETGSHYELLITADDYYKLYVNGRYVCQGPRPAYPSRYNYNQIDLTPYLRDGENEIRVHVYYQGLVNRVWVSGDNRMMLLADLFCGGVHAAGTEMFTSCERILGYHDNRATGYDTQFLEDFDFNIKNKTVKLCPCRNIYDFYSEPTDVLEIEPLSLEFDRINSCNYYVDIKQEVAATLSMTFHGKKGQRVFVRRGEEMDGGEVRFDMRCGCRYEEELILSGDDDCLEEFDYKAFRHIGISSDEPFEIKKAILLVQHHRFNEKIKINTDDETLKKIWRLCADTLKSGVQESFIDCPTREKGEYFGDAIVTALAYLHLTGDSEIYKRTLLDFADTARYDKGLLAVGSCSYWQEIADFSLTFPLHLWNYFRLAKDDATVRPLIKTADDMLEYFSEFSRGEELLVDVNSKWNLVDWPEGCRDGYDAVLDDVQKNVCHNVINAHYIGAHILRDRLADALGMKRLGKSAPLIKAFNEEFFDSKKMLYTDTAESKHSALHSNVLPLFYGFAPELAVPNLVSFIKEKGLSCGVFFSYFVLKALAKNGERDFALSLVRDERYWANMLSEGATTTFEAWGKDQKWNTSLCHPWACAPITLICEDFPELILLRHVRLIPNEHASR